MFPLHIFAWLLALSAVTPEATQEEPRFQWLTTNELDALLRGSIVVEDANVPSYTKTPEEFRRDGSHVRYADNYEAHGKYAFRDNAVCDQELGKRELCRGVLIDKEGRYWIVSREVPGLLVKVSVRPIP